jgi:hypothetical protein
LLVLFSYLSSAYPFFIYPAICEIIPGIVIRSRSTALGDRPETVIWTHLLRRGNCLVYVAD